MGWGQVPRSAATPRYPDTEFMDSEDERVPAAACNSILDLREVYNRCVRLKLVGHLKPFGFVGARCGERQLWGRTSPFRGEGQKVCNRRKAPFSDRSSQPIDGDPARRWNWVGFAGDNRDYPEFPVATSRTRSQNKGRSSARSVRRSRGTFGPFASGIRPDERRP